MGRSKSVAMSIEQMTFWPELAATACTLFTPAGADPLVNVVDGHIFCCVSPRSEWYFTVEETLRLVEKMQSDDSINTGIRSQRDDMLAISCNEDDDFDLHLERCRWFSNPRRSLPTVEAYRNGVTREEALSVVRRFFEEGGDVFIDAPGWDCEHYPNGMGNDRPEGPPKNRPRKRSDFLTRV